MTKHPAPTAPPQTRASTQTAASSGLTMLQTSNKKTKNKRPHTDINNNDESADIEMTASTPPKSPQDGEKKRRTEPLASTPTQETTAGTPTLMNPSQVTSTPSFLSENLHAYLTSPSPKPANHLPNYGDFSIDSSISPSVANSLATTTTMTHTPASSLKDRLLAAREREKKDALNTAVAKDPIEKYTKANFREYNIYHSHPTAALDHIDIDQVGMWETLPEGKLLAHPFGHEVKTLANHPEIKTKLFEAVGEITQSNSVGINAPKPFDQELGTPIVFLIYNISEIHRQMLLDRYVWSSSEITFSVTTLDPVRPDYLFSIKDLTTKSPEEVKTAVQKCWSNSDTTAFLETICQTAPESERLPTTISIKEFINSMWIKKLETKGPGDVDAPTFNVLAKGNYISDDGTWCLLKNFLATQEYALDFQDPGSAGMNFQRCSICYSVDHPRGLCPFPGITGWKGPARRLPTSNRNNPNSAPYAAKQRRGNWGLQRRK